MCFLPVVYSVGSGTYMTAVFILVVGCLLQQPVKGQNNPEENPYSGSPSRQDANFYRDNMSRSDAFASNGHGVTISNTSSSLLWLEQVTYHQVCSIELSLVLTAECKCHDFSPSFLYRRPFGVQKRLPTI